MQYKSRTVFRIWNWWQVISQESTLFIFAFFKQLIVVVFTTLAFTTPNWLEGDPRFYGTKMEKLGLWVHCFRSLPDYNDLRHQRFFAGCRWIFNPFTEGYPEIRNYLAPRKLNKDASFQLFANKIFVWIYYFYLIVAGSIFVHLIPYFKL